MLRWYLVAVVGDVIPGCHPLELGGSTPFLTPLHSGKIAHHHRRFLAVSLPSEENRQYVMSNKLTTDSHLIDSKVSCDSTTLTNTVHSYHILHVLKANISVNYNSIDMLRFHSKISITLCVLIKFIQFCYETEFVF